MKLTRAFFYIVAIASALFAGYLSFQVDVRYNDFESKIEHHGAGAGIALDSAKDGGAAGFAILAGLALLSASITHLKKEES